MTLFHNKPCHAFEYLSVLTYSTSTAAFGVNTCTWGRLPILAPHAFLTSRVRCRFYFFSHLVLFHHHLPILSSSSSCFSSLLLRISLSFLFLLPFFFFLFVYVSLLSPSCLTHHTLASLHAKAISEETPAQHVD